MDAVDKGLPPEFFAYMFRHPFICQQHELLDELVGGAELAEKDAEGHSLFAQVELDLEPLEGK